MSKYVYHTVLVKGNSLINRIVKIDCEHEFSTWIEANEYAIRKNKANNRAISGIWVAYYQRIL